MDGRERDARGGGAGGSCRLSSEDRAGGLALRPTSESVQLKWTADLSSAHRIAARSRWPHYYNCHRRHSALNGHPPISRVVRQDDVLESSQLGGPDRRRADRAHDHARADASAGELAVTVLAEMCAFIDRA